MRNADRLVDNLQDWASRSSRPGTRDFDKLRSVWLYSLAGVSPELAQEFFTAFLQRCSNTSDIDGAVEWLSVMGTILLQDYNGSELPHADWVELRNLVNASADTMAIDILTYIMGLVVDHGALDT